MMIAIIVAATLISSDLRFENQHCRAQISQLKSELEAARKSFVSSEPKEIFRAYATTFVRSHLLSSLEDESGRLDLDSLLTMGVFTEETGFRFRRVEIHEIHNLLWSLTRDSFGETHIRLGVQLDSENWMSRDVVNAGEDSINEGDFLVDAEGNVLAIGVNDPRTHDEVLNHFRSRPPSFVTQRRWQKMLLDFSATHKISSPTRVVRYFLEKDGE